MASLGAAIEVITQAFERAELSFGHGSLCAHDEAAWLVFAVAKREHHEAPGAYQDALTADQRQKIIELADARIQTRRPLAYLLGSAYFAGLEFIVTEDVLVPRSPLAELVMEGFEPWLPESDLHHALEIGTGSGCIAIALARYFPAVDVVATDISSAALEVARRNVVRHELESRVSLLQADVFDNVPETPFDLIISNPPYVDAPAMQALPAEYQHEPRHALAAGPAGLDVVEKMLARAAQFLSDHGILIVEVGDSDEALAEAYPHLPLTWLSMRDGVSGIFLINRRDLLDGLARKTRSA